MEITHHVSSSVELATGVYGINSEIFDEQKFIDSMDDCDYGTYV